MCFESEESLKNAPTTEKWAEAMKDNIGFVSHFDTYNVERITLIGEHEEWSDSQ